jgi:predicted TIM-barrel enzyme
MIVHFIHERILFDTAGIVLWGQTTEDDPETEVLMLTLPSGDEMPILFCSGIDLDSILTGVAQAAIASSPYILFDTQQRSNAIAPAPFEEDYE